MIKAPNHTPVAVVGPPCVFSLNLTKIMQAGNYPHFTDVETKSEIVNDFFTNARYDQN